jgi:enediyne biosynthesis protein E4
MMRVIVPVLVSLTAAAVTGAPQAPQTERLFRDISREAGVNFQHHAAPDKKYIVESMSGGVALFDFDNDGLIDIYFVDSLTVATAADHGAARSALYRNRGNGQFEDVTDKAGVGHPGWGMGVCTADVDGDGWEDLYVTALGGNKLYRNRHDGTFEDVTERSGVSVGGWSAGCGFADYDHDGDLDLFVSRYVKIDLSNLPQFGKDKTCEYRGVSVQCGPRGLPGESDVLLRNDGGRFTDVSLQAGVSDPRAYFGLGVAWFDANGDGWPDLYVANDTGPNYLYLNQKDGTFKEAAFPMGVAVSEDGAEQGSMGVAIGDYDHSGRFSLWVTNFAEEHNALYRNDGDHFTDVSFRSKTAASSLPYVGWGNAFVDYDNDGWLDLIAVNGHVYPQLDNARLGASAGYRQRKLLYHNRGDGTFDEVGARYGDAIMEARSSRGLAVADLDNDGRPDVVTNDLDGHPQILHNELAGAGNWIIVALTGRGLNPSAVGAVVTARTGTLRQKRIVQSGSSYLSQEDKRLHFGLGKAEQVDALEVTWPDGTSTIRENVKANQIVQIAQPR